MLTEIGSENFRQINLFQSDNAAHHPALMGSIDRINRKWGRDTVQYAASGLEKPWDMRQSHKSPAYTTDWNELPQVKAS